MVHKLFPEIENRLEVNTTICGSRSALVPVHFYAENIANIDLGIDTTFIRGVDISTFPQIDAFGGKFSVNGKTTNLLDILSDNGVNYIRLRLWHTPRDWYCGLESTLEIAKKVKAHGFKLLLDIHYSDWWADPANQKKPAAWEKLPFALLKDSVYAYTYRVISLLKSEDALPDMVQIGNEITPGMLFPDGQLSGNSGFIQLAQLLNAGINAVHAAANSNSASGNSIYTARSSVNTPTTSTASISSVSAPASSSIKIMLHLDSGGDNVKCRWWFDHILAQDVRFDIIGLSYYPWWHGTLVDLKNNMNDLAIRYDKDIIVVETAYPMTNKYLNDGMDNVGFDTDKLIPGYPVSVKGQTDFLFTLKNLVKETANKKGIGFMYWEPAWIWQKPIGTAWEYFTLFDPVSGEMLPSIEPFNEADSTSTGIDDETGGNGTPLNPEFPGSSTIPTDVMLYQNYPNPFNPATIIQYYLPESAEISLKIYDLLGREVVQLVNDTQSAGVHQTEFDAIQHHLTSGVYIYSITISPNAGTLNPKSNSLNPNSGALSSNSGTMSLSHSDGVNLAPHNRTPTPRTISKAMILVK